MNCTKARPLLALVLAAALLGCGEGRRAGERSRSLQRSLALAGAPPQALQARYQALEPPVEAGVQAAPPELQAVLERWGWKGQASTPAAYCALTRKLAFYREGWVWVTDEKGDVLKSLWFEPSLQAEGRLRWSEDGATLWIRADGWRRWLPLEVSARKG